VGAIVATAARQAPIGTCAILAGEPGDTIIRIVTAGFDSEATADGRLTGVGGVAAVFVAFACAAADHETTGQVFATNGNASLADSARRVVVTKRLGIGARGAELRGFAPGAAAVGQSRIGNAAIEAAVAHPSVIDGAVQVGACIGDGRVPIEPWGDPGRIRFATAGRGRRDQQSVSKEAHDRR
jgi:hypothetical protein